MLWIQNNAATLVVAVLLAAAVAAAIIGMIRRKRSGRTILGCGGDCDSCRERELCRRAETASRKQKPKNDR